mmetsp:Transcript_10994/g.14347  ORF Transcript_10994/g.14347 Transcript_10994/m.14347 type:complete len:376 (-) Transcript_10994:82-1209(-)|eukprot:CAMPEP_0116063552 /NCGR_PEP_ID=MMETSP0322-20121206/8494_1 /TAXON_ID=163516 /ORGANISM="Leptocylindrus danicus var. apora, Strain B651" /LENGTH=375 /DNA_ID=CAMNT_0003549215 /DNA_START=218 /DNA_END=1345 /DNA_ORIENTATION=-
MSSSPSKKKKLSKKAPPPPNPPLSSASSSNQLIKSLESHYVMVQEAELKRLDALNDLQAEMKLTCSSKHVLDYDGLFKLLNGDDAAVEGAAVVDDDDVAVEKTGGAAEVPVKKRKRGLNAYNYYIKSNYSKMSEGVQGDKKELSKKVMSALSKQWKDSVSNEDKKEWAIKAAEHNKLHADDIEEEIKTVKPKKKKKKSGYNLFLSENYEAVKKQTQQEKGESFTQYLGEVSRRWKQLDPEEIKIYNDRAAEMDSEEAEDKKECAIKTSEQNEDHTKERKVENKHVQQKKKGIKKDSNDKKKMEKMEANPDVKVKTSTTRTPSSPEEVQDHNSSTAASANASSTASKKVKKNEKKSAKKSHKKPKSERKKRKKKGS